MESIYIVYRGSESFENWLSDLDAILTEYPYCDKCQVHEGFYYAEQQVIKSVITNTKELISQYPTYKVVVTGHSLGAALATLTAVDFLKNGISPVSLINFGSPRVGKLLIICLLQMISVLI